MDLGVFSLAAASVKYNPLLDFAEDFGLKSVLISDAQLLIPWQKRVVSGAEMTTALSEIEKVSEFYKR